MAARKQYCRTSFTHTLQVSCRRYRYSTAGQECCYIRNRKTGVVHGLNMQVGYQDKEGMGCLISEKKGIQMGQMLGFVRSCPFIAGPEGRRQCCHQVLDLGQLKIHSRVLVISLASRFHVQLPICVAKHRILSASHVLPCRQSIEDHHQKCIKFVAVEFRNGWVCGHVWLPGGGSRARASDS